VPANPEDGRRRKIWQRSANSYLIVFKLAGLEGHWPDIKIFNAFLPAKKEAGRMTPGLLDSPVEHMCDFPR
jgi:hypothetical protein